MPQLLDSDNGARHGRSAQPSRRRRGGDLKER